jgi:hypothetical protein
MLYWFLYIGIGASARLAEIHGRSPFVILAGGGEGRDEVLIWIDNPLKSPDFGKRIEGLKSREARAKPTAARGKPRGKQGEAK